MLTPQGYTSVYEIIERVLDTFDNEDVNFSSMVRHIADALLLIGSFKYLENKVETVKIVDNRGELPCDIIYINQTRYTKNKQSFPLRYATESFHSTWHDANSPDLKCKSDYTYSLSGNHIFTSFEEGEVDINYRALATDDNGFPLIPDDIKFKLAVEYHLMSKVAEKLFLLDKITSDKFQYIQQQRDWYIGAAQARGNMLSHDQMETLANQMTRLIEQPLAHSKFYRNQQVPEIFRKQP